MLLHFLGFLIIIQLVDTSIILLLWKFPIEWNNNNTTDNNNFINVNNKSFDFELAKSMQLTEELKFTSAFAGIVDNNCTNWYECNFSFMEKLLSNGIVITLLILIILLKLLTY